MTDQDKRPVSVAEAKLLIETVTEIQKDLLGMFADLKGRPGIDPRWLQIGVTDIEKGFMSVVRAVFELQQAEIMQAVVLNAMKG